MILSLKLGNEVGLRVAKSTRFCVSSRIGPYSHVQSRILLGLQKRAVGACFSPRAFHERYAVGGFKQDAQVSSSGFQRGLSSRVGRGTKGVLPLTETSILKDLSTCSLATRSSIMANGRVLSTGPMQRSSDASLPEDGLTRYPSISSHQGILRGLDYMGTVVFALSGCVTAGNAGMDILGCTIVATITAVGGGTVRDLLLGNRPVFWMQESEYLWMCIATAIAVFFTWSYLSQHGIRDDMEMLNWADALGVGAFCIIGAQNGLRLNLSKAVCVSCGMFTATFGGVIRDVLCQRPPRILHSHAEIYASAALAGAMVYVQTKSMGLSPVVRVASGFGSAVLLRVLAWKLGIRLPTWREPPAEADAEEAK